MIKSMSLESGKGEMAGFGSPADEIRGWMLRLAAKLRLNRNDYHLVRSVELPSGNGTVRIGPVIVSTCGVFMLETLNMKGAIHGGRDEKTWIRQAGTINQTFPSPLPQNAHHANTLAALLRLGSGKVFPVLVFTGGARFSTRMPEHVVRGGGYVRYIKSKTIAVLAKSDVARIVHKLESGQFDPLPAAPAGQAKIVQKKKSKAAARACPRCGSAMAIRTVNKGSQAGKKFWVCSSYPVCKAAIEYRAAPTPNSIPDFGPTKFQ